MPPLAGKGIVITRPVGQSDRLAALVRAAGGEAILFPSIEIQDVPDPAPLHAVIDRLHEFDLAVFVSPNAASKSIGLIRARRALPRGLDIAAVGPGTARQLDALGIAGVLAPEGRGDSESLLALPRLSRAGSKRVIIFRGEGGREYLADGLAARGAVVEYATCYRRARPASDPAPLLEAWRRGGVHAVTVTSSEGLRNLCEMLGEAGRACLVATALFVPHPRIERTARELGIAGVTVSGASGDEGLLAALIAHFARR